jgi:hypothetical protein
VRRLRYGPNALEERRRLSLPLKFLSRFRNPLVITEPGSVGSKLALKIGERDLPKFPLGPAIGFHCNPFVCLTRWLRRRGAHHPTTPAFEA